MLGGIHFFVGSAISVSVTKNPFFAFILGILSHHLLDFLPHFDLNIFEDHKYKSLKDWDKKVWFLVISEFFFFFLLTFYFLGKFEFNIQRIAFLGGMGGIIPDVFTLLIKTFLAKPKMFNFYLNFHENFHYRPKNKKILLPILVELLVFFFSLGLFSGYFKN